MNPKSKRMICWPAPTVSCLRGECGYCFAGRMISADTIRRYANLQDMVPAFRFGTRNPSIQWHEPAS